MEFFETAVLDYKDMTAIEKLNYFRNMYYIEGDNTENGVIANAINEILPAYVKMLEEHRAQVVINHVRKIMPRKYQHLSRCFADISLKETANGLVIDKIVFEDEDSNYHDRIVVNDNIVVFVDEECGRKILANYRNWNELLNMKSFNA